jgi:hypothetical protein
VGPHMITFAALVAARGAAAADNAEACDAQKSPIVVENALPGVGPEHWDVNGAGCHEVQGFATRASVLPGASVSFKIKMSFDEALRIDVYRLGYYGGTGARKVGEATLVPRAVQVAVSQPDCLIPEPEAALWDCGNWNVVAEWKVPVNATSGYYIARAVLPGPDPLNRWREDASRHNYDPHHAVVSRVGFEPRVPPWHPSMHPSTHPSPAAAPARTRALCANPTSGRQAPTPSCLPWRGGTLTALSDATD